MYPDPTEPLADSELLKTWLKGRDAYCPACGYNLRDLVSEYCPECGRQMYLCVGAAQTGLGYFVTLIASLMLIGGFGSFLALFAIGEGMPPFPEYWYIWVLVIGSPAELLLCLLVIFLRRRFFRLRHRTQLRLALWVWGINIVFLVLFLSAVMG